MTADANSELPTWKSELDAIVGARHGGQVSALAGRLADLDARYPNVGEIAFQLGWTFESLGKWAEAIRHYERAVALGLQPNDHCAALIGLGNALRGTDQAQRAVGVLETAKRQFPEYREVDLYLALALHGAGRSGEALKTLMEAILDTTEDPGLAAHQRALRFHASHL